MNNDRLHGPQVLKLRPHQTKHAPVARQASMATVTMRLSSTRLSVMVPTAPPEPWAYTYTSNWDLPLLDSTTCSKSTTTEVYLPALGMELIGKK